MGPAELTPDCPPEQYRTVPSDSTPAPIAVIADAAAPPQHRRTTPQYRRTNPYHRALSTAPPCSSPDSDSNSVAATNRGGNPWAY